MGSPAAFEHRRHELVHLTGKLVSDDEVLVSFLKSVQPGEVMFEKKMFQQLFHFFLLLVDYPPPNYSSFFLVSVETGEDVFFLLKAHPKKILCRWNGSKLSSTCTDWSDTG